MRVVIGGASGLIGTALMARLRALGHDVTPLVRRPARPGEARWDPVDRTIDRAGLEGADAVVNLAGAGLADRRWSAERKAVLLDSRIGSTTLLCDALSRLATKPGVLVNASAVGFYGDRGDEILDEDSTTGPGFLAELCRQWERSTATASDAGLRVVHLRTGIVLAPHGGVLGRLLPLFRAGLGGRLATGRQWTSWISLDDEVEVIIALLTDTSVDGPVNAVAPTPVTNAELTKALGRALHRLTLLRVPATALRVALGSELTAEALLASQRVLPGKLTAAGYVFRHRTVDQGIAAVLAARSTHAEPG